MVGLLSFFRTSKQLTDLNRFGKTLSRGTCLAFQLIVQEQKCGVDPSASGEP